MTDVSLRTLRTNPEGPKSTCERFPMVKDPGRCLAAVESSRAGVVMTKNFSSEFSTTGRLLRSTSFGIPYFESARRKCGSTAPSLLLFLVREGGLAIRDGPHRMERELSP